MFINVSGVAENVVLLDQKLIFEFGKAGKPHAITSYGSRHLVFYFNFCWP